MQSKTQNLATDRSTSVLYEPLDPKKFSRQIGEKVFENMDLEKSKEYFYVKPHEDSHAKRRREILEKHPEIINLFVKDPISAVIMIVLLVFQLVSAYFIQDKSWPLFLTCMYVIGASVNHTIQILAHDFTHQTAFDSVLFNRIFAFLSNIPTCLPSAVTFQYYHKDHHQYLGDPAKDPLVTEWEIRTFNTPIRKIFFLFFMPIFFTVRPLMMAPKPYSFLEFINLVFIMSTNFGIYQYIGPYAFLYLALSEFMSLSLHPLTLHAIAEHYEFVKGQETYDYIGIANFFNLNFGYHVEHHDFPQVPWRFLPKVRAIAPKFYESLFTHTSYLKVAYNYIVCDGVGPCSRRDTTETKLKKEK